MFRKFLLVGAALAFTTHLPASDGKAIVEKACKVCHEAGVANAPKIGDKAAWEPRLNKGIYALLASVKNGLNAMPPGALCTACSVDDYKAAIDYMSK